MKFVFDFSKEKDAILKEARGISFNDVIEAIKKGGLLDNIDHFNKKKYPHQRIYIVKIKDKIYSVPFVIDKVKKITFLKTIYPSRSLKKKYSK